jgi:hypothetical protein
MSGRVRHNDFIRNALGVGIERDDKRQADQCAQGLRRDESRHGTGRDSGEAVREHPADSDSRVGDYLDVELVNQ